MLDFFARFSRAALGIIFVALVLVVVLIAGAFIFEQVELYIAYGGLPLCQ